MAKANGNGWLGRIILGAALTVLGTGGVVAWQRNNEVLDTMTTHIGVNTTKIAVIETTMNRIDENVQTLVREKRTADETALNEAKTLLERN